MTVHLRAALTRVRELFRVRSRSQAEQNEEFAFHLEMETAENIRRGMSEADARRAALLRFGGTQRFREETNDARGVAALAVREHCPHAAIVYDLFHALARYTAQVLDRVPVDEANRITRPSRDHRRLHAENQRRWLTGHGVRWLLLRARRNLRTPAEHVQLAELLQANQALFVVYVLKEDLCTLWNLRDPTEARRAWQGWYARACASDISALRRFADRLAPAADYIINHARHPLHTSLLEGINNKIKVMKRMAYGYRDEEYFFLKIRAAFPGIP